MSNYPKDLRYTRDHEWAKLDAGKVTVGITDHAQSALGDIVFVDLPKVGTTIKAGSTFGVVESVKAVSDLYAPIDGKVVLVNEALAAEPSAVNSDPYKQGWMIQIEPTSSDAFNSLMSVEDYTSYVESLN